MARRFYWASDDRHTAAGFTTRTACKVPCGKRCAVLVRSIAIHVAEIDPRPSMSYPRRVNTALVMRIVKTICARFEGTEYRQMCAYLKGRSTGRCVRI